MTLLNEPWPEVPSLVEIYDVENGGRWDHDFYLGLAAELGVGSVLDMGCGTGAFAVEAAARGLRAVGVDPAEASLAYARTRPGSERVEWIHGGADRAPGRAVELVILMGHVAQCFVDDDAWAALLSDARRVLVPGGWLAFETRNPIIDWAGRWTRERTTGTHPHPAGGTFTSWVQTREVVGPADSYTLTHEGNTVLPGGTHLRVTESLRFRSPGEVLSSLTDAGFEIARTWGDWDRSAFEPTRSAELIVQARRT